MEKKLLKEGELIEAPFLDGVAEIKKFEDRGNYSHLEAVITNTNEFKSVNLSDEQIESIERASSSTSFLESSEDFFLNVEASRIRLAYEFDPILAVTTSQIDPLPHQIEGVYDYALQSPKVRFMIADDAGAGKTIMAGLIIKELQYRKMANRILLVVPGHLKYQWQREMREKFNTNFNLIERHDFRKSATGNVWDENNQCIATIDFLKQDDIMSTLKGTHWDLVVADEAHKMSAYKYSKKTDKTDRYQAGEVLSKNSTHMLFLTATPHRGKEENFRLFLDLLRPGFFSNEELMRESIQNKENRLFIRRLKEDLKDFEGNKLFPPRHVQSVRFELTDEEKELYRSVTNYVRDYFDKAKEKRHIAFAMMILQRRLTSSVHSITESLKNRKRGLEEILELPEKIEETDEYEKAKEIEEEELEDMEEKERMEIEEKLTKLSLAKRPKEVKKEIRQVKNLIEKAKKVKEQEVESKLVKLRDEILDTLGDRKLLIFTEFQDTLEYLVDRLRNWGYDVNYIHGKMSMEERVEAEKEFKEETQIMVATEAAGEGINLQFCSLMVNYDIPWNPNRLTQRMGRIHRYGQDREVYIWNMIAKDTREGQILGKLMKKLETIREDLGSDRVFDIIGDVIPGTNFKDMFKDAIFEQKRMDEIEDKIDQTDTETVQTTLDDIQMKGLSTKHIDYTGTAEKRMIAEENRLVPEYIEDYFLRAFERFEGNIKKMDDYYRVKNVPYEIRKVADNEDFKNNYGSIEKSYSKITFQKEVAKEKDYEYVSPGHPLLEAVNEKIMNEVGKKEAFSLFIDESGEKEGVVWFFEGKVEDGKGDIAGKKVFAVYQGKDGDIKKINPSVLWDMKPSDKGELKKDWRKMLLEKDKIEDYATSEILFPYKDEIKEEREKETRIKEKYGLRSLEYLIQESNNKLLEYEQREAEGEDMEIAIFNEEQTLKEYQDRKEELEKEIKLEKNLTVSEPDFIGKAVVIPSEEGEDKKTDEMHRDEEIEEVGMRLAMEHEREKGREPEDVSEDNIGFDVRSVKSEDGSELKDVRYIEVKARAREGKVRLTSNEWKKAKRFSEDYWLYIVVNAGTDNPELAKRIQDPANKFKLEEDIYATGYEIPVNSWKEVE